MKRLLLLALTTFFTGSAMAVTLSPSDMSRVGRMVWQNESGGTVEGLVAWNRGEAFPSLGIGHFIWYPAGKKGPFDESFPRLVQRLVKGGVKVPNWAQGPAPWQTREEMERDRERVQALRSLLGEPAALRVQTEFLIERLEASLPKMLATLGSNTKAKEQVKRRFEALTGSVPGCFALIDYVNFKGEGVLQSERYKGEGWGLLQVLVGMKGETVADFSQSAQRVLRRRVENSPKSRGEARWLPGWLARVQRYVP